MTEQMLDQLIHRVVLDAARQECGGLREEGPEHSFSPEFERKMKRLVRQADHPARHRLLRTGQLAAALAALLLLLTVAAAAAGYDIWRMMAQWTAEEITLAPGQVEYAGPQDLHIPEEPGEYGSMQEALSAYGLNQAVAPKRMPEGFALDELIVDDKTFFSGETYLNIVFVAFYRRGEDSLIVQINVYLEDGNRSKKSFGNYQKDEGDPVPYEAGGVTHLLTTNAGRPAALWVNGPAECAASGDITMEEMKGMIDSIYE